MYRFSQLDLALVVAWAVVLTLLRYRVQRWAKVRVGGHSAGGA